jgi:HD-like signal output (HDOD) protein
MAVPLTIRRIISIQPIDLPVFHPIALKLIHLLSDINFTVSELEETVNEDQVLAGQILKMANSTNFIGRVKVETIKDALIRLGAHLVSNLAMAASQAALHVSSNSFVNDVMQELWFHSHACALGSRWVAMNTGHRSIAEQAYLAGLVHDVGKLHLLKSLERLVNAGMAQAALERNLLLEIFHEMHVEQGTRLMEHWNMPQVYRTVSAKHHEPDVSSDDLVLAIVRLVNVATRTYGLSLSTEPTQPVLELPEAARLNFQQEQLVELGRVLEQSREVTF